MGRLKRTCAVHRMQWSWHVGNAALATWCRQLGNVDLVLYIWQFAQNMNLTNCWFISTIKWTSQFDKLDAVKILSELGNLSANGILCLLLFVNQPTPKGLISYYRTWYQKGLMYTFPTFWCLFLHKHFLPCLSSFKFGPALCGC